MSNIASGLSNAAAAAYNAVEAAAHTVADVAEAVYSTAYEQANGNKPDPVSSDSARHTAPSARDGESDGESDGAEFLRVMTDTGRSLVTGLSALVEPFTRFEGVEPAAPVVEERNFFERALWGDNRPPDSRLGLLTLDERNDLAFGQRVEAGGISTAAGLQASSAISALVTGIQNPILKFGVAVAGGTTVSRVTTPVALAVTDPYHELVLEQPLVDPTPGVLSSENAWDFIPGAISTAAGSLASQATRAGMGYLLGSTALGPLVVPATALAAGVYVGSKAFVHYDQAWRNFTYDPTDPVDVERYLGNLTPEQRVDYFDRQALLATLADWQESRDNGGDVASVPRPLDFQFEAVPLESPVPLDLAVIEAHLARIESEGVPSDEVVALPADSPLPDAVVAATSSTLWAQAWEVLQALGASAVVVGEQFKEAGLEVYERVADWLEAQVAPLPVAAVDEERAEPTLYRPQGDDGQEPVVILVGSSDAVHVERPELPHQWATAHVSPLMGEEGGDEFVWNRCSPIEEKPGLVCLPNGLPLLLLKAGTEGGASDHVLIGDGDIPSGCGCEADYWL